jgi:hypothetical protein
MNALKRISRHFFRKGGVLAVTFLFTGCSTAWLKMASDVDNTLRLETLVSRSEIQVVAFDHNPNTGQVFFIGFPGRYRDSQSVVHAAATLYRLDLRTGTHVEVYRNFDVERQNVFIAALRDGGVMVFRGWDDYRSLRGDADYSLLTFRNDALSDRLDVIRGSDLAEGKSSYPLEKRADEPERELPIERNCRALVQQSSSIDPIGHVVFRVGDEYATIPRFIAITRQHADRKAALDVLRCGGYNFYTEFAHRITTSSATLWNPDTRGGTNLYSPDGRLWNSADFQIPGRQFRIRTVSPSSLTLVRLYHNFDCEQYVQQIFYRERTYQTGVCAGMTDGLPASRYLFTGDDFLLLSGEEIMKGSIPERRQYE